MTMITLNEIITKENYKLVLAALVPLKNNDFFDTYITKVYELLNKEELVEFHNHLKSNIKEYPKNNYLIHAFKQKWHNQDLNLEQFKKALYNLDDLEVGVYIIDNLPIEKESKEDLFSYYLNYRSYHFNENNVKYIFEIYHQYDFLFLTNSIWDNSKIQDFLLEQLAQSEKLQKNIMNIESYRKSSCIGMLCQCKDSDNNIQKLLNLGLFDNVKDHIRPHYMTAFNDNFAKVYNHYNINFKELMKQRTYFFTDFVEPKNFNHSFSLVDRHKNEFLDSVVRFLDGKEKIFPEKEVRDYIRHFKKDKYQNLIDYWHYFVNLVEFDKSHGSIAQAKIDLTNHILENAYTDKIPKHIKELFVFLEKEKLEEITQTNKMQNNIRLKL